VVVDDDGGVVVVVVVRDDNHRELASSLERTSSSNFMSCSGKESSFHIKLVVVTGCGTRGSVVVSIWEGILVGMGFGWGSCAMDVPCRPVEVSRCGCDCCGSTDVLDGRVSSSKAY
jgi:hypothetical protein